MTEVASKRRGRPPRVNPQLGLGVLDEDMSETVEVVAAPAPSDRPALRPSLRDDPRAAAARRAAEIRGHLGDMDEGTDDFRAPRPPDGWEYEWKRKTVLGMEDPAYQVELARMGWEPVPTVSMPEMMPGMGNHPNVERKGMALMMRPAVISQEARAIEQRKARNQIRAKEAQLNATPDGTLTRDDERVRPKIKKSYEPIPVPNE
jgi:hypothetical protein